MNKPVNLGEESCSRSLKYIHYQIENRILAAQLNLRFREPAVLCFVANKGIIFSHLLNV